MKEVGSGEVESDTTQELSPEAAPELRPEIAESETAGESTEPPAAAQSAGPEEVPEPMSATDGLDSEPAEEIPASPTAEDEPMDGNMAAAAESESVPEFVATSEAPESEASTESLPVATADESATVELPVEPLQPDEPVPSAVAEADASAEPNAESVAPPLVEYEDVDEMPGHGHARHGAQVTDEQHIERLTTGIAPDGSLARTSASTSFFSDELELEAVNKAIAVHQAAERVDDAVLVDAAGNAVLPRTDLNVQSESPEGFGSGFAKEDGQIRALGTLDEATVVTELDLRTNQYTTPFTQYPSERDE